MNINKILYVSIIILLIIISLLSSYYLYKEYQINKNIGCTIYITLLNNEEKIIKTKKSNYDFLYDTYYIYINGVLHPYIYPKNTIIVDGIYYNYNRINIECE